MYLFQSVMNQDIFHKALIACCMEIVLYSYNSQRYHLYNYYCIEILYLMEIKRFAYLTRVSMANVKLADTILILL